MQRPRSADGSGPDENLRKVARLWERVAAAERRALAAPSPAHVENALRLVLALETSLRLARGQDGEALLRAVRHRRKQWDRLRRLQHDAAWTRTKAAVAPWLVLAALDLFRADVRDDHDARLEKLQRSPSLASGSVRGQLFGARGRRRLAEALLRVDVELAPQDGLRRRQVAGMHRRVRRARLLAEQLLPSAARVLEELLPLEERLDVLVSLDLRRRRLARLEALGSLAAAPGLRALRSEARRLRAAQKRELAAELRRFRDDRVARTLALVLLERRALPSSTSEAAP